MSEIQEILEQLARQSYPQDFRHPAILQYVRTGDETLLKSIPKTDGRGAWTLIRALPSPDAWTVEAERVIRLAVSVPMKSLCYQWLYKYCRYDYADWAHYKDAVKILGAAGLPKEKLFEALSEATLWDWKANEPTEAGMMLLMATDAQLPLGNQRNNFHEEQLIAVLARKEPKRLETLLRKGRHPTRSDSGYAAMVRANPKRFHKLARKEYDNLRGRVERLCLLRALGENAPGQYRDWACGEAIAILREICEVDDPVGRQCCQFLLAANHPDALDLTRQWMARFQGTSDWNAAHQRELVLKQLQETHPEELLSMAEACTHSPAGNVVLMGLDWWEKLGIGDDHSRFLAALRRTLNNENSTIVISGITRAVSFDLRALEDDIWPLMEHKSRPVRGAAARALAGLGFKQVKDRALKLLHHKKADIRQAAVTLLGKIEDQAPVAALKERLDAEKNENVRDDILLALEQSGGDPIFTPEELQERIAVTLKKVKEPPVTWISAANLTLRRADGTKLSEDEVLYLLYRQSRCKEMRADLEAKPIFASLKRSACGESALDLCNAFLGSEQNAADRWVLAFVALTGDDSLVPLIHRAIIDWADNSRGKLAEYGAQALALLGTDAALMVVDSLSVRYRSKYKNIGKAAAEAFAAAAEARGVSVEELGDLVVPWLGFEPGQPRLIRSIKGEVEVRIDSDFKLKFRDTATGKKLAKLPAGTPPEIQAEFKTLTATLKEAVKAQLLRIETLLVRQFRWPAKRWKELYLGNPLLKPFTERLIWAGHAADGSAPFTFRALEDGSLTDVEDESVELPDDAEVSLVHPLDLEEADRAAWLQHLVDYNVAPPFAQLDRPVVLASEDERALKFGKHVKGTSLNAMTFRGRAEKLGWTRGSVADAGFVSAYRKVFAGAGVEAFLYLDGMYVGIGVDETIELDQFCFVKAGSVQIGSYVYDEPSNDDDPRLIPFGDVPPVPFSEVMGDLAKISGKEVSELRGSPSS